MFAQVRRTGDAFADIFLQPRWKAAAPATAFRQEEVVYMPEISRQWLVVALLVDRQHLIEVAQPNGCGLHNAAHGNPTAWVALFDEGVDMVIKNNVLLRSQLILTVAIGFIAHLPYLSGVSINHWTQPIEKILDALRRCTTGAAHHLVVKNAVRVSRCLVKAIIMIPTGAKPAGVIIGNLHFAIFG